MTCLSTESDAELRVQVHRSKLNLCCFQRIAIVAIHSYVSLCHISERKVLYKARFKRRIFVASNAIETKDNEASHLIIFCFNCIRCDENATFKTGLTGVINIRAGETYRVDFPPAACACLLDMPRIFLQSLM